MIKREIREFWTAQETKGLAAKHLTARQRRRVRALARTALAERGIEASIHADHLTSIDGRVFGLENLASKCLTCGLDESEWGVVVRAHFDAFFAAFPGDTPPGLTPEQLRKSTYVRLAMESALPVGSEDDAFTYVRRLGGGLVELLAYRDGDVVRWLRDEDVALVGLDELRAIGRQNLLQVEVEQHDRLQNGPIGFEIVRGESGFIASKLCVLPELLGQVIGDPGPYRDGVLFSVPTRYELAFAPVHTGGIGACAGLWSYAPWAFEQGTGPLSPYLYWWRDGEVTQVSYFEPTGTARLHRVPDLERALGCHPSQLPGAA